MDANALPKGHIIGWAPPPTTTSNLSKSAKKNAKRKQKRNKEGIPDNWDDDESGPSQSTQDSKTDTPVTTSSTMTTTNLEPAADINQQVSSPDIADDLSSKLEELDVK